MFPKNFVPELPFPNFKWKWACLQCTEGIDDPVVLLGVLFRMRKLEGKGLKYSSPNLQKNLSNYLMILRILLASILQDGLVKEISFEIPGSIGELLALFPQEIAAVKLGLQTLDGE